jgi:hypothetical protein
MNGMLMQAAETDQITGLTAGGWTVMLLSVAMVFSLAIFCITRILKEAHPETHHHAPLEIDTKDTGDDG